MTTQFLSLSEGDIAYELDGPADGQLVVCVHGIGDTRASYRFLTPALAEAGFQVATMDVRGSGESSLGWSEYSTTAVAQDIRALITHLGGRAVVIGHSFAAGSAAGVAIAAPELIERLVLIGPAIRHAKLGGFMKVVAALVTRSVGLWMMYTKSLYPGDKPADFAQYRKELAAGLRRRGRMAPVHRMMESFDTDVEPDLSKVSVASLIIMGGKDGDFPDPAAEAQWIADGLSGPATVTLLPSSGHYPHSDNAAASKDAVLTFLKER